MGIIADYLNGAKSIASQIAGAVGNGLIDLGVFLGGDVPTSSLTAPSGFVPPFSGGQCTNITYSVLIRRENPSSTPSNPVFSDQNLAGQIGAIGGMNKIGETWFLKTGAGNQGLYNEGQQIKVDTIPVILSVTAENGVDNCGDLSDPAAPSPQSNPIPISAAVGIGDASVVAVPDLFIPTPSIPVPPDPEQPPDPNPPSTTEGIALALPALLKNVAAALSAIKNVVDILNGLKDLIDKLSKKDGKKEIKLFPLGLAARDGYVNLQSVIDAGYVPYKVNILITRLPPFLSKEITDKIPFNYYNGLGRVQSVDGGFNICSFDKIQHIRQSVFLKEDSVGFYYSFGREDKITAQLTLLAIKDDE